MKKRETHKKGTDSGKQKRERLRKTILIKITIQTYDNY